MKTNALVGTITAIHKLKWGNGTDFRRITFKLADGSFAKTDLCPTYRNFKRWEPLLLVGAILDGLDLKTSLSRSLVTVDADSHPKILGMEVTKELNQMELL